MKRIVVFLLLFLLGIVGCEKETRLLATENSLSLDPVYKSVCLVTNSNGGRGTGFFYKGKDTSKYHIMTSGHVLDGAEPIVMIELFYEGIKSKQYFANLIKIEMNIQKYGLSSLLKHPNPVDVAILEMNKFEGYSAPNILELAPKGYVYKDEIVKSSGFPRGAWSHAWIGNVTKQSSFLLFEPVPAQGRSGSPIVNKNNQVLGVVTSTEGVAVRMDKIREVLFSQ